ncbi:MAG: tetratricopeptide repeat protein [Lachnospiraceae bacterium]|nr:tetratricopeptide repeat protein [Lachnospiraceae bacterium]
MAVKRKRRKSIRKRKQQRNMIVGMAALVVIAGAATAVWWNLPNTKLGRYLDAASAHLEANEYEQAQQAYEAVLEIDETNELAYRGLADDYLAQDMQEQAEAILHEGYEVTGSEVLLQNYRATVLNDVVEAINAGTADYATVGRCLDILEETPADEDAQKLLLTLAPRVLKTEEDSRLLLENAEGKTEGAAEYELVLSRIFALAQTDSTSFLPVLEAYLIPEDILYVSMSNRELFETLLKKAAELGLTQAQGLLECLEKQAQISEFFAPMFADFEAANYKAAKDFIVTEEFLQIRDAFIEGTMEYWKSNSYVSVTKEALCFEKTENGWQFEFVEDDSVAKPTGTIRILAVTMKDLGVQRSCIEYVPAYDPANYYPHTEYEIVYWNTMVSGIATDNTNVVSRMNYRFAEKIFTATGMEANMIYDWGGKNESRKKE